MPTRSMPSSGDLERELRRFVPEFDLLLTAGEVTASGAAVPPAWSDLLRLQDETDRPAWPEAWTPLLDLLPNVRRYLAGALRGVAILSEPDGRVSLLYVATSDDGQEIDCYRGGPPLEDVGAVPLLAERWAGLPEGLRHFYTALHDGWTELASRAGGPAAAADLALLSDPSWDLDASVRARLPFSLADVLLLFSNAAGDYLGLDRGARDWRGEDRAVIWFHEEPDRPAVDQEFWAALDAWFSIFTEDADLIGAGQLVR